MLCRWRDKALELLTVMTSASDRTNSILKSLASRLPAKGYLSVVQAARTLDRMSRSDLNNALEALESIQCSIPMGRGVMISGELWEIHTGVRRRLSDFEKADRDAAESQRETAAESLRRKESAGRMQSGEPPWDTLSTSLRRSLSADFAYLLESAVLGEALSWQEASDLCTALVDAMSRARDWQLGSTRSPALDRVFDKYRDHGDWARAWRSLGNGKGTPGFVYALANRGMRGLIKIGRTSGDPIDRAKELSHSTGVPFPFKVVHSVWVLNAAAAEAATHEALADSRVNNNREFFRVDVADATATLNKIGREY